MRTFSVVNNKLMVRRDASNDKCLVNLNRYVKLNNLIIDGAVVSSDVDTNEAAIINTRDGEVASISFYKNGYHMVSEHSLDFRVKMEEHNYAAVRFDQSFTDWFETVKNTGTIPSLKFDIIDNKLVVTTDGEIITHEVGYMYLHGRLRAYNPVSNNTILIGKPYKFGDDEVISLTDGIKSHFFYISPKTMNFTEAFREWRESLGRKLVNLPRTFSVAHGKLIVNVDDRIYEYEIGNIYLDRKLKLHNSNSDTTIFLGLTKDDSGILETIEIYHNGGVVGYYVDPLSWGEYTDRIVPTTLDQSFMKWFNAVKAMPAIA